jgi:dTDP-4-dehydrorhamnose 3,5-epimerase
MELIPLALKGVYGINSSAFFDERGSFLRLWDKNSLGKHIKLMQASAAVNPKKRTLRGLHFQTDPHAETKIIQCVLGSVFDVVVDLRKDSSTYGRHISIQIGPKEKYQGIIVPKGFAHGYLTLESNSTLLYFMDHPYIQESAKGIAWNDPNLKIGWPYQPKVISKRDCNFGPMKNFS